MNTRNSLLEGSSDMHNHPMEMRENWEIKRNYCVVYNQVFR